MTILARAGPVGVA